MARTSKKTFGGFKAHGGVWSGPTKTAGKIDSIMGGEIRSPLQRKAVRKVSR